ncbi:Photosynthetic NDH subunit of lumenal location 2 [Nymphaea thermarum]|nr:Photosynthetic NDH subunit of lumenal location 2 [Nymphaea thermarum]
MYRFEEELSELEAEPAKTTMKHGLGKGASMPSMADLICRSRTTNRETSPKKSSVIKSCWEGSISRRAIMTTMPIMGTCLAGRQALAEEWGTHSLILERFFLPDLSPENSAARIRQTAQGMHGLRHMLDTMSWRYVIFYIRQKASYLSSDLKNALATLPENRRQTYIRTANELVDNMSEVGKPCFCNSISFHLLFRFCSA